MLVLLDAVITLGTEAESPETKFAPDTVKSLTVRVCPAFIVAELLVFVATLEPPKLKAAPTGIVTGKELLFVKLTDVEPTVAPDVETDPV